MVEREGRARRVSTLALTLCAIAASIVLATGLVVYKLVRIGWVDARAGDPVVMPIEMGSEDMLRLSNKFWMLDARIHNIHIGQVVPFHRHPVRQEWVAILRGEATVRGLRRSRAGGAPILRVEERLGVGDFVLSPATAVHEFENVGSEPLWTLVIQSPPFRENFFLAGAPPQSDRDFIVLPWKSMGRSRGATLPPWSERWARDWRASGRASIDLFPGIPARLLRGDRALSSDDSDAESWIALLSGAGSLSLDDREIPVEAPVWIRSPRGPWSIRNTKSDPLVALELRVPTFDLRLFVRGIHRRHFGGP